MKKIILLTFVLFLVAAGCNTTNQQKEVNQEVKNSQNTQTPPNSQSSQDSWKVYKNEKYGFQLTLTDAWKGYKVSEGLSSDNVTYNIVFQMDTYNPDTKKTEPDFVIFGVSVLPKSVWDQYPNDPLRPKMLAEKQGQVFFYTSLESADKDMRDFYNKFWPKDSAGKPVNFEFAKVAESFKFYK